MVATVRALELTELPLCESFAREFHAEKKLPGVFKPEVFLKNWTEFLTRYEAIIFTLWYDAKLVGGLGAMITPDLSDGRRTASEMFWYVTREARNGLDPWKLVDRFEFWGEIMDVDEYRLTHLLMPGEDPAHVRLAPLYKRRKYTPLEVGYYKTRVRVEEPHASH